jgi:hypothetical protein
MPSQEQSFHRGKGFRRQRSGQGGTRGHLAVNAARPVEFQAGISWLQGWKLAHGRSVGNDVSVAAVTYQLDQALHRPSE